MEKSPAVRLHLLSFSGVNFTISLDFSSTSFISFPGGSKVLPSTNGRDNGNFVSWLKQKELISKLDIFLTNSKYHLISDISLSWMACFYLISQLQCFYFLRHRNGLWANSCYFSTFCKIQHFHLAPGDHPAREVSPGIPAAEAEAPSAKPWFFNISYAVLCLVAQSCLTICDPMDCSPPGSSVHAGSLSKNTGVGCHSLLQGISLAGRPANPGLPPCRQSLYHLSHQGSPFNVREYIKSHIYIKGCDFIFSNGLNWCWKWNWPKPCLICKVTVRLFNTVINDVCPGVRQNCLYQPPAFWYGANSSSVSVTWE